MVSQFYISVFTLLFVKINTCRGARLYIKHVVCGHTRSHKRIVTEGQIIPKEKDKRANHDLQSTTQKTKIEQHEPHEGKNPGTPEG
jgi:hypothetical protein